VNTGYIDLPLGMAVLCHFKDLQSVSVLQWPVGTTWCPLSQHSCLSQLTEFDYLGLTTNLIFVLSNKHFYSLFLRSLKSNCSCYRYFKCSCLYGLSVVEFCHKL